MRAFRWATDVSGKPFLTFWHRAGRDVGRSRCGKAIPVDAETRDERTVPENERCGKCVWREVAA